MFRVLLILICLIISFSASARVFTQTIEAPKLMAEANDLSHSGQLRIARDGFVYISVPQAYINKLYPLIAKHFDGTDEASCFQKNRNSVGAHISVSRIRNGTYSEKLYSQAGRTFDFEPVGLKRVDNIKLIDGRMVRRTWYVLTVKSPEIKQLMREVHSPIQNQELHVSIADAKMSDGKCLWH